MSEIDIYEDGNKPQSAMGLIQGVTKILAILRSVVVNGQVVVSGGGGGGGGLSPAPLTGQAIIVSDGTAVPLAASSVPLFNGVIVSAKSTNVNPILVGGSGVDNVSDGTGNGAIIDPGSATSFAVQDVSSLFINGSAGDIASYSGS